MPSCRVFKEQHATAASPSRNLVRSIIFRSKDTSKLGPRQAPHVPASCSCCIEILFFFVFFFLFLYIFSVLEFYLKECFNICGDVRSRIVPRIALHEVAFLVQKELFEVPRDVRARHRCPKTHGGASETSTGQNESVYIIAAVALGVPLWIHRNHDFALHPFEEWVRVCSIHVRFAHDVALGLEATARPHVLEGVEEFILACTCSRSRNNCTCVIVQLWR